MQAKVAERLMVVITIRTMITCYWNWGLRVYIKGYCEFVNGRNHEMLFLKGLFLGYVNFF
jgi:hypothetical protein